MSVLISKHPITEVLVFKTNIGNAHEQRLQAAMNKLSHILQWNVDLEDCDRILRIESCGIDAGEVVAVLSKAGYQCQELPD